MNLETGTILVKKDDPEWFRSVIEPFTNSSGEEFLAYETMIRTHSGKPTLGGGVGTMRKKTAEESWRVWDEVKPGHFYTASTQGGVIHAFLAAQDGYLWRLTDDSTYATKAYWSNEGEYRDWQEIQSAGFALRVDGNIKTV